MSGLHAATSTPARAWLLAAAVVGIIGAAAAAPLVGPSLGKMLFVGAAALALGALALRSPVFATLLLLVTIFLFLPLRNTGHLVIDLNKPPFALLIVSTALWLYRNPGRLRGIGAVEWAMALYLIWNIYSMFALHEYTPGLQRPTNFAFSVPRFILTSALIPFVLYAVGRYTFDRAAAVRTAFWVILATAAYSAMMSIISFTGPTEWVWPRYSESDQEGWFGRAVGVFNQPVVNGMVLALGFAVAMFLASRRSEPAWRRLMAFVVAVGCGCGIYLTYTRAAWLSLAAVLIIGATLASGFRKGFITVLCLVMTMIAINWSVFTSTDREAGGVASPDEVQDRLNANETGLWAAAQKPLTGWGIGRFDAVNTYHHQQWSTETPWIMGYGESSHQTEMGILVELGLIGLVLWICVLTLLANRLWKAYRTLPVDDICGKPLAVIAIMGLAVFVCTGLTVDLRNSDFDFPRGAIFLLAGITIGWYERHKRRQAAAGGDFAEQVRPRHA